MRGAAYVVEWLKLRRSPVPRVTAGLLVVVPAVMAALFLAMAGGKRDDAIGLKAQALVTRDGWQGYLDALTQIDASAGLLGMGVVVAWCFGREYADRTVGSLFGSATPRESVAAAKLAVLALWSTGVSLLLIPAALLVGLGAGLGPPDGEALAGLMRVAVLSVLTGLSALTIALFASVGRGYLPAFGGLVGLVAAAQVAVVAGVGEWFPYAVPGLWAMASVSPTVGTVPVWHLLFVPCTAAVVGGLTVVWWHRAELS
ncbi:MAG: ABC transporter permease [Candidatus Nanopelagicales bacterium]